MAELRYTTAGESHGPQLTVIVTGLPSGLHVRESDVNAQLARRQGGHGRSVRQQIETDTVDVTGGLRHGATLGTPLAMQLVNADHTRWTAAMSPWPTDQAEGSWRDRPITVPRPGHADLAGAARHGTDDMRNVLERASARETAARTAAGAIAMQLLQCLGIEVHCHVRTIGTAASNAPVPTRDDWDTADLDASPVRALDADAARRMVQEIDAAAADRDTLGGVIEACIYGVPPGIGGYATAGDRLGARLGGAVLAVPAIKGVEFGDGFAVAALRGSEAHDELAPATTRDDSVGMGVQRESNHAGGLEGGMSNGSPIVLRAAMKPLSTLMQPLASVDIRTGESAPAHAERSDVCAVPAAAVVVESVLAFELAAVIREHFGNPTMADVVSAWEQYCERVRAAGSPRMPVGAGTARD